MEEILRMEMIAALLPKVRDGMDSSNGIIQTVPAQLPSSVSSFLKAVIE